MSIRGDPVAPEHLGDGQGQDFDVQPQAPVIDIPDVKGELLFPGKRVAALDLRPAGNARLHVVAASLFLRV